jgi:hypothetical protein
MKLKILAAMVVVGAVLALGTSLVSAAPGPQDHSWNVQFSTTAAGSHPDITVTLTLGTNSAAQAPAPTAFFDEATTTYAGNTPTAANKGAAVGNIDFSIQSSVDPTLIGVNNIQSSGQAPQCGASGTLGLGPVNAPIYAATKASADGVVSSDGSPFPADQSPDTTHGGVPEAVLKVPDWYTTVLNSIGAPEAVVVARNYAIAATTPATHTSVNFLTLNTGGGVYANVTVLANPIASFSSAGQTTVTCPPFTSIVAQQGTSTAHTWDCSSDYFGNPVPSCTGSTVAASSTLSTLAAAGSFPYQIALSSASNLDSDTNGAGTQLFGSWDNCKVDANPSQSDANNNGIGDACKGGGTYVHSNATAIANASLTCSVISTTAPYAACQDADQDGALNASDNCPLVANTDTTTAPAHVTPGDNQLDSDRDGIGDACDPNPSVIGTGTGYAPGADPGVTTTGQYSDFDDICNAQFSIGGATNVPGVCLAQVGISVVDSNDNGIPDFLNPGSGQPCVQDHASDSNNDGYSDADQTTPAGTPSCTGAFPAGGGLGQDALKACPGRNSSLLTGTPATQTAAKKALADPNHDGNINILDLSQTSGSFLGSYTTGSDKKAELDYNKDKNVNILDLSIQSGFFLNSVPPC